jgi:hypothetical protein
MSQKKKALEGLFSLLGSHREDTVCSGWQEPVQYV